MGIIDIVVFIGFICAVLFVGMFKSKGENTQGEHGAEDYFLAGRGLSWWLIGFSLIAANISAEQFVGMSGQGAGLEGISCASWEWLAAVALVVVAFSLLPYFLKTGITTIPEFLEVRYNHWARTLMTVSMMGILIGASLIGVTYAGSLVMKELFSEFNVNISFAACCWIMGGMAGVYVLFGGLKACAWADLIQGSALILGGAVIAYFALQALGDADVATLTSTVPGAIADSGSTALERFRLLNANKLIMGRDANDPAMPWTILLMGIWIPNFYYWGLNQYITQRILGSGSLAEGQKGLVLAASLKLLIPFIIVVPGIIAFNLFSADMKKNALEDFHHKVIQKVEAGTLAPNTFIMLDDTVRATLTPAQCVAVEKNNATLKARVEANSRDIVVARASAYKYDSALGILITKLIPRNQGILGFVLAALLGAIVSSLAAVLNATSTLFTMDIYSRYINPKATQGRLVFTGRATIAVLVVIGCLASPLIQSESIFAYIQQVQGYVSPGVLAVFIFGLLNRRAGRGAGVVGLLIAPCLYWLFNAYGWNVIPAGVRALIPAFLGKCSGEMHYLIAMSYTLVLTLLAMAIYGVIYRLPQPVLFESKTRLDMTTSKGALIFGLGVILLTLVLYVIFW